MEFKDTRKLYKVSIKKIHIGVNVLSTLQVTRKLKKKEETYLNHV